jgi:hypothetical protein
VRLSVTNVLYGGVHSIDAEYKVADALMCLMQDVSDEVRDWATFGLGSQLTVDTSGVRAALFERASDSNEDVRDEAIVGLALRRDRRALGLVQAELATDHVGPLIWEAAEHLADPVLSETLHDWLADNPDNEKIAAAVRACDREAQAMRLERQAALLAAIERLIEEDELGIRAAVCCERFSGEVLLTFDASSPYVRDVDILLAHNDNDVERAARIIVDSEAAAAKGV